MDNIKNNPIKYVKIFALLYLIVNAVSRIIYNVGKSIVLSNSISFIGVFVSIVFSIVPISLFIVHIFKFYGTNKTQLFLPVSYIVSIVWNLFGLVIYIKSVRYMYNSSSAAQAQHIVYILFTMIGIAFSVFLLITCLNGFKTLKMAKRIVLINAAVSFLSIIIETILDALAGYSFSAMYLIVSLSAMLAQASYIVFWLYAVEKRDVSPLESQFLVLKQQYEKGILTEEKYIEKKSEILKKL